VRADGSLLSRAAELKIIRRATSLPLSNSKTSKSPARSGCLSSPSLAANCQRRSRLRDGFSNLTHGHPLCTSMTEYLSARVKPLYALSNKLCEGVCPTALSLLRVRTNKEVAGNQFVLAPSIIFAVPNAAVISESATRRTHHRAQISSSTSPVP